MHKKPIVLHSDNSLGHTGAARALLEYCVDQQGYVESIVLLPKGAATKVIFEDAKVKVYEIHFLEIGKDLKKILLYFPRLFFNAWMVYKIARAERVDLFHSNDLYNLVFYVVKYIYRYNRPIITHIRLLPTSYVKLFYPYWKKLHLSLSDKLIAVSSAVRNAYGNSTSIEVVYDVKETLEKHPKYYIKESSSAFFEYLYLANYIEGKGQIYALEALVQLGDSGKNIRITFAGDDSVDNGRYLIKLKEFVARNGLQSQVIFEGFVFDVEYKMKQYQGVLNFSISESFSYTCYDALRFGIPLIASDCGGPAELFINMRSGILVANKNSKEMGFAMKKLADSISLQVQFSEESRRVLYERIELNDNHLKLTKIFLSSINQ